MAEKQLSSGHTIPEIGFGVWQIDDMATMEQAVGEALQVGYRQFDTAQAYGNEARFFSACFSRSVQPCYCY